MTTDEIYAAAREALAYALDPSDGIQRPIAVTRAIVDAVAPLLIAQGRREAAEQLRREAHRYSPKVVVEARACMQEAARITEGGAP